MRRIANIFFLFMATTAIASNNSSEDSVKTVSLRGTRVEIPQECLDKSPTLLINDILISKSHNGYVNSTLTPQKWSGLNTFINKNDYQIPILAKGTDNSLMIFDTPAMTVVEDASTEGTLSSLTVIKETNSINDIKDKTKWMKYDLTKVPAFSSGISLVSLPNNSVLIVGAPFFSTKNIFSIIDYKNQKVTPLKYWPNDGVKCASHPKRRVYTDDALLYGNGKGHFLYQCEWSRFAFIFSIEGKNVNVIKELFTDYPKYKSDEQELNFEFEPGARPTQGLYTAANNDKIYMLLKDSDRKGNKLQTREDPYIYGNTVIEYDWEGNKKRTIHLDHYGQKTLLSDDNKTLYLLTGGYSENIVPKIWSYDISNLDSLSDAEPLPEVVQSAGPDEDAPLVKTLKEGDMMENFVLYDYQDKPHQLCEFVGTGKYTVLEFSSIGCGPCQAARPLLELFYAKHKDRIEMITISEDKESLWKTKPTGEVSWHEWNDHDFAHKISKKYGVNAIPAFIVIDPSGKILNILPDAKSLIETVEKYLK